jgi:hypothetical protein
LSNQSLILKGKRIKVSHVFSVVISYSKSTFNFPEFSKIIFCPVLLNDLEIKRLTEIKLFAHGFIHSKILAQRLSYFISNCQFSFQFSNSYDWSFRLVGSISDHIVYREIKDKTNSLIETIFFAACLCSPKNAHNYLIN